MRARMQARILALAGALLAPLLPLGAQDAVRLVRVPDELALPLPAGANRILEVEIEGTPRAVWIASKPDDAARVPLQAAGDRRWQVNLAEPRVAALASTGGRLQVFAEAAGGKVLASAPIVFAVANALPECWVHTRDEAIRVSLPADVARWFDAALVRRLEVRYGNGNDGSVVSATSGDAVWPLRFVGSSWTLALEEPHRQVWRAHGILVVEVRQRQELIAQYGLQAVPHRLEPAATDEVTVVQRRSAALPGSRGYFQVRLGDITAGQVLVELHGARGENLLEQRSLRPGQHATFTIGDEGYVLTLVRLTNLLIGDDFAILKVRNRVPFEERRIDELLARVERSTITFEREGKDHTGVQAAEHLRGKLQAARAPQLTCEEFIRKVASRSSTTGNPYHVRKADGTRVEAEVWLREQVAAIQADEEAAATRPARKGPDAR